MIASLWRSVSRGVSASASYPLHILHSRSLAVVIVSGPQDVDNGHYCRRREKNPVLFDQVSIDGSEYHVGPLQTPTEDTPYHSNAPNTTAPLAAPQTLPLQKSNPERRTAAARKLANQNIMVTASAARMAYLCAAVGKKRGESARYGTANAQVQIPQKRRKLICDGDISE